VANSTVGLIRARNAFQLAMRVRGTTMMSLLASAMSWARSSPLSARSKSTLMT
jgi:hypothetical protein